MPPDLFLTKAVVSPGEIAIASGFKDGSACSMIRSSPLFSSMTEFRGSGTRKMRMSPRETVTCFIPWGMNIPSGFVGASFELDVCALDGWMGISVASVPEMHPGSAIRSTAATDIAITFDRVTTDSFSLFAFAS